MPDTTLVGTQPYRYRYKQLHEEVSDYRAHWREIAEFTMPRKGRYLFNTDEKANDGKKKHQKIINGTATDAIRTVAAGMQSGLTSPSRPWFTLTLEDKELAKFAPVKQWLQDVRDIMLDVFHRSNFYGSIHGLYKELAVFGVGAMLIEEDFRTVIRCRPFTIGEFNLGLDKTYRPDTLYRRYSMTAQQMVDEFGQDVVTESVRTAITSGKRDTRFDVMHAIQPRKDVDTTKDDYRGMGYDSVYFQVKADTEKFLRKSGYKDLPFVASRWDVTSTDTYGECPGMDAKGDIQMLQKLEEKKLKKLDKHVDPPMNAPVSMKGKGGTIIAGGVNWHDEQSNANNRMAPTYQIDANFTPVTQEIMNVENRIRRFFFNDLFLSVLGREKRMTATEIAEVHEEKFLMLGPVIERQQSELYDPTIDRTFNICSDTGLFPPPPKELEGVELNIEYISLLAQAQKIVSKSSIESAIAFVGNIAQVNPEAADKLDADEAIDQYASTIGTPPRIIKSTDSIKNMRAQRAQQQAQAQQQMQADQMAQTSKTLADAKMGEDSALDRVLEGIPGALPGGQG